MKIHRRYFIKLHFPFLVLDSGFIENIYIDLSLAIVMDYKKLIEKYKEFILEDPIIATNAGIHEKDNYLSKLTKERFLEEVEKAKQILGDLKAAKYGDLAFKDKIDLDLMELNLKKVIFSNELKYNNLFDYEQNPNAGSTLIDALLYLFLKDPRELKTRLDAINSRIKQIPLFLQEYKLTLKKTIDRWKNIEKEELEGITDLFENIFVWANKNNYIHLEELRINIKTAKEEILSYLDYLNSLEVIYDFSIGEERAQELVKLNGIDLTLLEIFNISKSFFINNNIKISHLMDELKKKYSLNKDSSQEEVVNFIKEKFSIPIKDIVEQYKKDQEKVMDFVKKTNLFVLPKSDKLMILKTPSYLVPSIPVGAIFPPAPFENGPKTSLAYFTIDDGRKKDQNTLMITNNMIHEGIPGHHLQFAVAYENNSVVRKLADYNIHSEGWTTYLEQFMGDIGFIDESILNESSLIALSDFARLGARVAIDLYFMTNNPEYLNVIENFMPKGDTSFEKAKSLLQKATGFTDARAEGELNWYSKRRGYPMCYLLGNELVSQLQKDVLDKFENKEEGLKLFHKTYLNEGIMPLSFLRKIFEENKIL